MDESSPLTPASAVAVPILTLVTLILDLPPLVWHIRNHNIGASSLVSWVILCNFMNFINALIWPMDNISAWWKGQVLCDIEVKLSTATWLGVVGSLICIMRSLANVLDTDKTKVSSGRAQKQRQLAIELLLCIGAPVYMMLVHYVVQPTRYWITTVMGCVVPFDRSWPSIVLVAMWPPIFSLIVVYYSGKPQRSYNVFLNANELTVLTIHRIRKYRKDFSSILNSSNSNITRNRFLRLFIMSVTLIVIILPAQGYILYDAAMQIALPYSWSRVHGQYWSDILLVPTGGKVTSDRWIQIALGFALFMFFGMGHEAKEMYRKWLLYLGLGKIFPSLRQPAKKGSNLTYSLGSNASSVGSRARLIIHKISNKPSVSL